MQANYQDTLRFLVAELQSRAVEVDRAGRYPTESIGRAHQAGVLESVAPRELGGCDLGPRGDMVGYFELLDGLSIGCSSTAQIIGVHNAAMATVKAIGSHRQLEFFAGEAAQSGAMFCYLGSEPGQRLQHDGTRVRYDSEARRVAGGWIINATKNFATGSLGARYIMALCMVEGAEDMSGVLLPVIPVTDPAVVIRDTWDNMGQRATTSGSCEIRECFVPDDGVIGGPGDFLRAKLLGALFQLSFAAQFNGIAQAAMNFTVDYLRHHATAPRGLERAVDEPHVHGLIGEMSVKIEAGRALVRRAANMLGAVERDKVDAVSATTAVYQAKCHATQAAVQIGSDLFRLCGARVTATKHDADLYWRNARTLTLHDNYDRQIGTVGRAVLGIASPAISTR